MNDLTIVQDPDFGVILTLYDGDLADSFEDFLNTQRYVLFNVRFRKSSRDFLFGQAADVARIKEIYSEFIGVGNY